MQNELLFVSQTARLLGCSEKAVRKLEARGELRAERAANGIRIFKGVEVRRLARERSDNKDRKRV